MAMDFAIGGLAGVGAGFFSNPFDVVKTRMQLQGELRAKGQHAVHYRNVVHGFYTIVKHDGIAALQKGLAPALVFQLVVNGTRLGIYQHADNFGLLRNDNNETLMLNSIIAGGICGGIGALAGSPLLLIKTQLMSQSSKEIAVGTQHMHKGMLYGINSIYRESGIKGLWRGAHSMIVRNAFGSSSQIATFACSKEWIERTGWFKDSKYLAAFVAGNLGAIVKTIVMTPLDVIVTRLYNQGVDLHGKGLLYSGISDCAIKITKAEGIFALYKGLGPSFLRQAPHSVLLLVFWDILKDVQRKLNL